MQETGFYGEVIRKMRWWRLSCLVMAAVVIFCAFLLNCQTTSHKTKIAYQQRIIADLDYENNILREEVETLKSALEAYEAVLQMRKDKELLVQEIAPAYNLPVGFVRAIMDREGADMTTVSAKNRNGSVDRGVMQLNSDVFTTPHWSTPEVNMNLACYMLSDLVKRFNYNWWNVAVAYNSGASTVTSGNIPSKSVNYANAVMKYWKEHNPREYVLAGGK